MKCVKVNPKGSSVHEAGCMEASNLPVHRPPQALAETTSSTDGHMDRGALVTDGLPAAWTQDEVIQKLQLRLRQLMDMRVASEDCTVEAHPNVAARSSKRTTQRVRITTTPAAYHALYTLRKQLGLDAEEGVDESFPAGSSVYSSTDGSGLAYSEVTFAFAAFKSITGKLDRLQCVGDEVLITDGIITATINSLKEKLGEGAPCDESMNDLRTLIGTYARETSGVARGKVNYVKRDWWNEDCAAAWNDMMSFRMEIRDPVSGKLPAIHRATWKAKHRAFKKARKAAIQEIELENIRRRIKDARSNPRGLWTWLRGGKPPPCGISDINGFTEHFSKVLKGAGPAPLQQLEMVSDAVAAEAAAAAVAQASALVAAAMIPEPLHPAPGRPWFGQAGSKLVTEAWLRYGVDTPASRNVAVWTFHTEPNPSHHLRNYPSILPHLADMSQHFDDLLADDLLASGVTEQYDPSQRYASEVTAILEAAATGPVHRGDLQTLASRLTFVVRACRWGYTFLQGIYDALSTLQYPPPSSVALPEGALDDLHFWQDVLCRTPPSGTVSSAVFWPIWTWRLPRWVVPLHHLLAAAGIGSVAQGSVTEELARLAVALYGSVVADSSSVMYELGRRGFVHFCVEVAGVPEADTLPRQCGSDLNRGLVCLFIVHVVGRYAASTVTGTLSALADWQRFMGVSPEAYISRDPLVKRTLGQALRRTAAGPESAPSMAKAPLPLGVLRLLVAWLRLCDCGAVEDGLDVFDECPAYKSIRAKYDGDLVFEGCSMRTIMTEAPPVALPSCNHPVTTISSEWASPDSDHEGS
ncbi:hypothetical protein VOLCADRAFT_92357 [Volvox carteri f. nagariensis]|uniref:Uncharacterized protein n=1 Tax=Volvox carteri f. nagariensis TaxID=3068 RepID=D8TZG2_VOLCA|nr:uncharacterized protein VOLCADRAFT_92357 [Volvox carteri f. nagariensis]EFJ47268.1 hypothetical protein VOLCADRAFT_92357 [Volvox carteri f. nagariensis]|eukprot:XP_002951817.1 hypothetical protein VOLCADRAFT_92357 [Volvox carteri f. nagariensis]